ncbi:hypothetical protein BBF96_13510 [Anoxybacter fermentans]|uniref:Endonuclease NucS C-terminal domain-containing protein n=1 Tax=Anoxybacter fermentans TaxID=1323375 RepID=A0A3Q9HTZ2_9FIRM|nr:endonuclease NucS domain-containing protein [Anoxybacter fermentans]AZR74318.1 hypothetical protein BBF96_13510 [Anoxybacter fermentans]
MPQEMRLWKIESNDRLKEINISRLDLEERIENWLENDISMISDNLLVIGRQVKTDYGKFIDLLCLDINGDAVIIELKRDKTPRDVIAQVLDYASWVKELSNKEITDIANKYLSKKNMVLDEAFENKFNIELPDVLNENHKMFIVASEMDSSTERIINYLSGEYGIGINVITFQYFQDENQNEYIGRVFLIEPEQVDYNIKIKSGSKRRRNLSFEELEKMAEDNGVLELYKNLTGRLQHYFDRQSSTMSSTTFIGKMEGSNKTILGVYPEKSSSEKGLYFSIYIERLAKYLNVSRDEIINHLPKRFKEKNLKEAWSGGPLMLSGFLKDNNEINNFIDWIEEIKK